MKNDAQIIYAFCVPVIFPEGFSVGSSGKNNKIEIERNGQNRPVLRGSSIAGVFRSEIDIEEDRIDYFFGHALDKKEDRQESRMIFFDLEFKDNVEESVHNLICRHTGSISTPDNGLFSLQRVASGSTADLRFYFRTERDYDGNREFLDSIVYLLRRGLSFGGSQARGTGRAVINGDSFRMKTFDLETEDGLAGFLDLLYADQWDLTDGETVSAAEETDDESLFAIDVTFGIPRGQDILCSEGNDAYPVTTEKCDSKVYWKIPGSSIRGIFRAWFSRLAARDGETLSDSMENYKSNPKKRMIDLKDEPDDPIADLFGFVRKDNQRKGRIHITDAISNKEKNLSDVQYRAHVAIDSFSGGTNPGRLFSNYVLTNSGLEFRTRISIVSPVQEDAMAHFRKEIDWLEKTLRAVQLGLVRFGSSKASGRLEIRNVKIVCKPEKISFNTEFERI